MLTRLLTVGLAGAYYMFEAKRNPVPLPQPEVKPSSESSLSDVRTEASFHKPTLTKNDLLNIAHKLRYDLDSARAKVIELQAYITHLDLPDEPQAFNETRFLQFVRNTAHVYTDESIADEARIQGAPDDFIPKALELASKLRR